MSWGPLLLLDDLLEDQRRERLPRQLLDQHFGLGMHRNELSDLTSSLISPFLRSGRYYRPWHGVLNRQDSGISNIKFDDNQMQVLLDVQQFSPEEITVKTVEGALVVEGKHEEKQDEHGFISRQFKRRYPVPKNVDVEKIASTLSSDGVLTVSMPVKGTQIADERSIPIVQTGAPAVKAENAKKPEKTEKTNESS